MNCCLTPSSGTFQYRQLPLYSKFSVFYNSGHRLLFLHRPRRGFRTNQTRLLGFLVIPKSRARGTKFVPTPHLSLEKTGSTKHTLETLYCINLEPYTKPPRQSQQRDNSFDQRGWRALESRIPLFQSRYNCVDNRVKYILDSF